MKFYTPKDLEKGDILDSDMWYLYLNVIDTSINIPDIPYLNSTQSKEFKKYGLGILEFEDAKSAYEMAHSFDELPVNANLIHNGNLYYEKSS